MKQLVFRDYLLAMYYTHIFDYQGEMQLNYRNTNNQQKPDSSKIQTPDRQYFSFLKELNLNNPQYLYAHSFPAFTQELLTNNILNIPRIRDTPVDEWVRNTKQILAPLLGFDQGMFYDMLIGNAYGLQFEVEVQPLSPTQIDNIKKYYKGSDLEKLLLRRNQEVIQTALSKNKLVINDTPGVPAEALMNAIIARYKGKTVIVDFWATWCIPCLEAIKDSRALKMRIADNDATFIYITNPSSPKKLWKERIQGIGGEHYYLTSKEWTYLYEHYKFEGVPSYLVFDKKGY
ncbi:TlpA family protein disulfide reductase [Chitinophaga sedimenti]|uniref:TlpA family protein disulfide reductase n=1 Tax=Chitinophaga sedimenti TaxID=2033606 RepID=UPI0020033E7D|nr:TlpA family protein disulfide reductase [Chitinophaga sedimenti]MCK7554067.1 TlpA family protein disulfide reductase [Chitinophaga sedimenti]